VAECLPPRSASDKKQSSLLSSHLASLRIKHKAVYVLSTQPPLQYIRFFKAHIVALLISRGRWLSVCHLAPFRTKSKAVCFPPTSLRFG